MPIFIPGKTRCPLCRQPVEREQPRAGFPSFLRSTHSLSILSDAVAHQDCFDQWQYRDLFLMLFDKFDKLLDGRPRELDWRDGENWIRIRGEEFDRAAEALDPARKGT